MRILHVINGLTVGGAEMSLFRLLGALRGNGCEFMVASLLDLGPVGARIEALGVPVVALEARGAYRMVKGVRTLAARMRDFRPDLIQGWMYHGNLASLLCARLARCEAPVLWNIRHSLSELSNEKPLTALAIRSGARLSGRAEIVIYNARASARQHEALGFDGSKTRVIENGVDLDQFRPRDGARAALRASLGFPESWILVGLVARYHPMKGHSDFLRAAGALAKRYGEVGFVLVGRDVDSANAALESEIRSHGISDRVRLMGEREDVAGIVAGLDVLTTSSRWGEGFPNVVAEAMACGVPCVVTDVGDSAYLVGDTGIVVEPGDAEGISGAWSALVDEGAEARRARGLGARRRIERHFALSAIARQYASLYEDVSRKC